MLTIDASVWVAAFDSRDRHHKASVEFLRAVAVRRLRLNAPVLVAVETSCALARLLQNAAAGQEAARRLRENPALELVPLRDSLLQQAEALGAEHFLRGADALYAATARATDSTLISWNRELIERAGAITPDRWRQAYAGHRAPSGTP